MNGKPLMGRAVRDVDGMPYGVWSDKKDPNAKQKWRKDNGTCNGYNASAAEKKRVEKDAKLRAEGKPQGTMPAPGYSEKAAKKAAKSAADDLMKVRKALKILTGLFVVAGGADTGNNAFAGVMALNDAEAIDEYKRAMDGLIRHQRDPNSTGLFDADVALFGPVDMRINDSTLLLDKPPGVITKILAAYARENPETMPLYANAYARAQQKFFEQEEYGEPEKKSGSWWWPF